MGTADEDGGKMTRSTAYRIFTDPFYYGEFEYPKGSGNWYQGKHEPMIERRIRPHSGIARTKRQSTPANLHFAFTGMIRCEECGCLITAENKTKHQKNGITRHYTYYHCTKRKGSCKQKTIRDNE